MSDPRITTLENALKALGINPDNDPLHHAKRWISGRDDDRRERDRAVAERDDATARVTARDMRIADLERDLADKTASLKTAHAALNDIADAIGAPPPVCPEDVVDEVRALLAAKDAARSDAIKMAHAAAKVSAALDDAGAPAVYTLADDSQRPIPDPERIRILGDRLRAERRERERASIDRTMMSAEVNGAHDALDERGVPCLADGLPMTPAARIRAIPR